MKYAHYIFLLFAMMAFNPQGANASTTYGDLGNFDAVNDTGQECQGFEIELEGIHSTDISYTYDWNHYGVPKITDDNSDPARPRVFIRYASAKNPDGTWVAHTSYPTVPLAPTDGHSCTDITRDDGCEHYGVGVNRAPTAERYHWLCDDGSGTLVYSAPVLVAAPNWTYAPAGADPVAIPAVVVAAIPAPMVPIPVAKQFGEPSWVKVIKTTMHNANNIALADLISDDADGVGGPDWQNGEAAEVESEFTLLQTNTGANPAKEELLGLGDDMGDGSETVTRRYEFYKYAAAPNTIDGENGEAMCDEVNPTTDLTDPMYLHGIGTEIEVAEAGGGSHLVNCEEQVVVGDYIGAQMAGFAAAMPLGLIDNLQDGELFVDYTPRTVVVGGDSPYDIVLTGSLPTGLTLGDYVVDPDSGEMAYGVLSGTPSAAGTFYFTVQATDAKGDMVSKDYTLNVPGGIVQYQLTVSKDGSGTGAVTGNGIDCGATCSVSLDTGTLVSLTATPDSGSVFTGWSGDCSGTGTCDTTMSAARNVTATFVLATQQYTLAVTHVGSGTVTSNPKGINCGNKCSYVYKLNTSVTLTAKPKNKHLFLGWSGACSGTNLTCTVPITGNKTVGATFN